MEVAHGRQKYWLTCSGMNKTILVTGANRGMGLEICRQLAALGHTVVLTSRNAESGGAAAASIEGDVHFLQLDVSSDESVKRCLGQVREKFGRLDVLINNAGIIKKPNTKAANLATVTADEVQFVFETNYFGPMRMSSAFLSLLKKSDDGRIINMSSGMGAIDDLKLGGYAGYRLSKAGLNAQTIQLAAELANTKVKVNAMCPGWVRTDMGGSNASRPVEKGAETAVWLATAGSIKTGKFWRDKKVIPW